MKIKILHSLAPVFVALALPLAAFGAEKKMPAAPAEKASEPTAAAEKSGPHAGTKLPYQGKVSAVDATAKTFSIKGKDKERVFVLTDTTKITKDGNPVEIGSIASGETVRGQAIKVGENWEAASVMLGEKVAAPKTKKTEMKAETKAEPKK